MKIVPVVVGLVVFKQVFSGGKGGAWGRGGCQGGGVKRRWDDEGFEVSSWHIQNDGGRGSGECVGFDVGRPNVFSHCAMD